MKYNEQIFNPMKLPPTKISTGFCFFYNGLKLVWRIFRSNEQMVNFVSCAAKEFLVTNEQIL